MESRKRGFWEDRDEPRSRRLPTLLARDNQAMAIHSAQLLDHFQNPRNVGHLPPPAITVDVDNPACGDMLRLSARVEHGKVAESQYQVRGCTAAIAAGSVLTEWMVGKDLDQLASLTVQILDDALGGLQPASKHVAVLCLDSIRQFLQTAARVPKEPQP